MEKTMKNPKRSLKYIACLAAWSVALPAATTTAYIPVCCNANSTVSVVSTAKNRVSGSLHAGPGSYAIALPDSGTASVTNAGNNTISIVSLKTGAVRNTIHLSSSHG
jgi:DNA-binding beta-propeller fold protein YncE